MHAQGTAVELVRAAGGEENHHIAVLEVRELVGLESDGRRHFVVLACLLCYCYDVNLNLEYGVFFDGLWLVELNSLIVTALM